MNKQINEYMCIIPVLEVYGNMSAKKILLIDGHGIAFRAFYAIPHLSAPDGTPTNALVGFFNMLAKAKHELNPDEIYTAFARSGRF